MATLHQLLTASARRHPDRTAVEDPERATEISYQTLDACSDELAGALAHIGVGSGDRVGIYAPKSIGTVASIFGILKAGAAYVPVDPGAPASRNAYIFQDCSVRAIVVDRELAADLQAAYGEVRLSAVSELTALEPYGASLVLLHAEADDAAATTAVDGLSYILYTSGSTGRPKGVVHTHTSALSFVDWCSDTFAPTEADRFSSHAPFHFDLSILDLYVPLKHGAALVLIGETLGKQALRLAPVIAERKISVWYSTPSILRLLVEHGKLEQYDYSALHTVLFAGEVFPVKHFQALRARWPHPRYHNLYGPTETNVCTWYEVPAVVPEDRTEPFPIGRTCPNDRSLVVDEHDVPVAPGTEGELYITGGTVMQGYWNLPQRTAQGFFVDETGTSWYRTGDIVREDENGDFLFIGRRDRMVKRRGYRVELGEIEAALYRHPAVKEAAVIALPDEENGVLIKACVSWESDERPSVIRLKQFCASNLPLYMVPDRFSFHTLLPKTSTDKVDYQKLAQID